MTYSKELSLTPVGNNAELIERVNLLSKKIYLTYYSKCLSEQCANKMYEKYQTIEAMTKAIENGEIYYLINSKEKNVGYLAVKFIPDEKKLFLSKLYVSKETRGQGVGRFAFNKILKMAKNYGASNIQLFTYKRHASVDIYKKFGFKIVGEKKRIFGDGLIVDDYLMQLDL